MNSSLNYWSSIALLLSLLLRPVLLDSQRSSAAAADRDDGGGELFFRLVMYFRHGRLNYEGPVLFPPTFFPSPFALSAPVSKHPVRGETSPLIAGKRGLEEERMRNFLSGGKTKSVPFSRVPSSFPFRRRSS